MFLQFKKVLSIKIWYFSSGIINVLFSSDRAQLRSYIVHLQQFEHHKILTTISTFLYCKIKLKKDNENKSLRKNMVGLQLVEVTNLLQFAELVSKKVTDLVVCFLQNAFAFRQCKIAELPNYKGAKS